MNARPAVRLGFVGAGWIGRARMDAVARTGRAVIGAVAEPLRDRRRAVASAYPDAVVTESLDTMLDAELDGVVIATPNSLHAEQAIAALSRGLPVFCQKPLAPTAHECQDVIATARTRDRRLDVDLSYRHTAGLQRIREIVRDGALGRVYAMDLIFHNAYAPDRSWCRDRTTAGGGCLLDLGVHLIDTALWVTGAPGIVEATGVLHGRGTPWNGRSVEDHAEVRLILPGGTVARIACSWDAHIGRDAIIDLRFTGARGAAVLRNVNGSFFDFRAERHAGTRIEVIAEPPDDWGPGALLAWIDGVGGGGRYDAAVESQLQVAAAIDSIYASCAF